MSRKQLETSSIQMVIQMIKLTWREIIAREEVSGLRSSQDEEEESAKEIIK